MGTDCAAEQCSITVPGLCYSNTPSPLGIYPELSETWEVKGRSVFLSENLAPGLPRSAFPD